jgi:sulfide:quinone oxidoreductase
MKGLPISDEVGFVITDRSMRNPGYPEVFAAGDAAGATVPKLATLGHKQSFIVARQLAVELGTLEKEKVGHLYDPAVVCYGDMGDNKAFYIHSNIWYGGSKSTLKMGHLYYMIKVALKNMYFSRGGKIKSWELDFGEILSDHL